MEGKVAEASTFDLAQGMAKRLDQEFRQHHHQLLDLIEVEDEDSLDNEQKELDKHDDLIEINLRMKQLVTASSSSVNSSKCKALTVTIGKG